MLQAEVGSAKMTEEGVYPSRGHLMRDFTLPSMEGGPVSPYDYRGHSNLVLIFAGDVGQTGEQAYLSDLAQHSAEIRDQNAQLLLVLACSRKQAKRIQGQEKLPFLVITDEDMQVHKMVGAIGVQGTARTAIYVTDRFLEVFAAWRTAEGSTLPDASEVLSWLEYINSQCPECTQAEWPADD
jgi:peroxiredoxin